MSEEGTEPIQTTSQTKERPKKSQRPSRPLTHNMSARALQDAYYKDGQLAPSTKSRQHSDKKNAPRRNAYNQTQEKRTMLDANGNLIPEPNAAPQFQPQSQQALKPAVPGTQPQQAQQVQQVRYVQDDTFNVKCMKAGGTGFVVLLLSQLSWFGLRRWLG